MSILSVMFFISCVCKDLKMSEDLSISKSLCIQNVEIVETKILGRGSYGIVYEARYHGAMVAVKKLHPIFFEDVSADENIGILRTWRNELQLMSTILHPNIVQFYGVYNSDNKDSLKLSGNTYIVSELMHKSLRARNNATPKLKYSDIINILYDIAAGLCFLHERPSPIMHRDLASKNILLTISGQAKIADLGVAKIVSQKKESLTRHPGTDAYMPVEAIAFDNVYDCSIDIYGLGVIALELGIGRDPKATQCLKKVGMSYVPVEEEERRKVDFAELTISSNAELKNFIMQCLDTMESRISAITALEMLRKEKESMIYKQTELQGEFFLEKITAAGNSHLEEQSRVLKEENTRLESKKKDLEEKVLALHSKNNKQENDIKKMEGDIEQYKKQLKEKDNELEELKKQKQQHLELLSKKQADSYISRDPSISKNYSYNSSLHKPQPSRPAHGSLVIPSASGKNILLSRQQPTFGSQQVHSAKVRPASTIVTGSSRSANHVFTSQRIHGEDNCPSDEIKYPPQLLSETSSFPQMVVASDAQSVLTHYCQQIDNEFARLKHAATASSMAAHMKSLKNIMENYQRVVSNMPKHLQDSSPEVNRLSTELDRKIGLLKKVNLHQISINQTDQLSQKARVLQADLI